MLSARPKRTSGPPLKKHISLGVTGHIMKSEDRVFRDACLCSSATVKVLGQTILGYLVRACLRVCYLSNSHTIVAVCCRIVAIAVWSLFRRFGSSHHTASKSSSLSLRKRGLACRSLRLRTIGIKAYHIPGSCGWLSKL